MKFNFKIAVLIVAAIILPACMKKHEIKKIQPLTSETANYTQTQQKVTLNAKQLNQDEVYEHFGKYVLYTNNGRLTPVHITIINKSDIMYALKTQSIVPFIVEDLELYNLNKRDWLRWSIGSIVGGWVIGGLLFVPSLMTFALIPGMQLPELVLAGSVSTALISIITPSAAITYMQCYNNALYAGIQCNLLKLESIMPDTYANGVIFVQQKDLNNKPLSVTLFGEDKSQLCFPDILNQ